MSHTVADISLINHMSALRLLQLQNWANFSRVGVTPDQEIRECEKAQQSVLQPADKGKILNPHLHFHQNFNSFHHASHCLLFSYPQPCGSRLYQGE